MRKMLPALLRHERLTRGRKEGVDVAFLNAGGRLIELHLDSHPAIISYAVGNINAPRQAGRYHSANQTSGTPQYT